MNAWRAIDTGIRLPAENFALNRALLEARQADEIPGTLRFLRFPPCALLGYHQSAEQELNLEYCAANGITIQRRLTGGGAIYMDENQLGWELYLTKQDLGSADMTVIARRICEAAARGIGRLGVDARYRPRNDIEVDGRKISGTGGAFDGEALMYQGTLLIELDVEKMLRILRIPAEKLSDKALSSVRERVVSLKDLLGQTPPLAEIQGQLTRAFAEEFGAGFAPGELTGAELARYRAALGEIDHPDWVDLVKKPVSDMPILEAFRKFSGGLLRASVSFDASARRIKQVWFSGDVFVSPPRTVNDLEAALKDVAPERLEPTVQAFFAKRQVDMLGLAPQDFAAVVNLAVDGASA